MAISIQNFLNRLIGRSKRERSKRRALLANVISWMVIGSIALFVLLLVGQFISHTWINPPVSSQVDRTDLLVKKGEHIQLTVLNGSGESDLARKFTDYLRARKFDVVEMANYTRSDIERSFIIDRVNDRTSATKLAYALGIDPQQIKVEIDSDAFVDAALVIGKDYRSLKPLREGFQF